MVATAVWRGRGALVAGARGVLPRDAGAWAANDKRYVLDAVLALEHVGRVGTAACHHATAPVGRHVGDNGFVFGEVFGGVDLADRGGAGLGTAVFARAARCALGLAGWKPTPGGTEQCSVPQVGGGAGRDIGLRFVCLWGGVGGLWVSV